MAAGKKLFLSRLSRNERLVEIKTCFSQEAATAAGAIGAFKLEIGRFLLVKCIK